jgi:hypothetical protein
VCSSGLGRLEPPCLSLVAPQEMQHVVWHPHNGRTYRRTCASRSPKTFQTSVAEASAHRRADLQLAVPFAEGLWIARPPHESQTPSLPASPWAQGPTQTQRPPWDCPCFKLYMREYPSSSHGYRTSSREGVAITRARLWIYKEAKSRLPTERTPLPGRQRRRWRKLPRPTN